MRASPCFSRKSWSTTCRYTARATSATPHSASSAEHEPVAPGARPRSSRAAGWPARFMAARCAGRSACGMTMCSSSRADALDAAVGGPGALLELQLAPLDVEVVARRVSCSSSMNSCAPRAWRRSRRATSRAPRPTAPTTSDAPAGRAHAASLSATRSTALRARGLRRAPRPRRATIAPPTRRSRGRACGGHVRQAGVHRVALLLAADEALDDAVLERVEADRRTGARPARAAARPAAAPTRAARARR